jgi:hypothetical protein
MMGNDVSAPDTGRSGGRGEGGWKAEPPCGAGVLFTVLVTPRFFHIVAVGVRFGASASIDRGYDVDKLRGHEDSKQHSGV